MPASQYTVEEQRRRVRELMRVRQVLLPDRDDAHVLSELTVIEAQLAEARQYLAGMRHEAQEAA